MTETSLAAFLAALQAKKDNPDLPYRFAIVGGGGGFNGAYLAGVQTALLEYDLRSALSMVVGVSTSIPSLAVP